MTEKGKRQVEQKQQLWQKRQDVGTSKPNVEDMIREGGELDHTHGSNGIIQEGILIDEQNTPSQQPLRKKMMAISIDNRHTPQQIQVMEAYYKECQHPDANQRVEIGQQLRLKPAQVKFWFQNRRTQEKVQKDREENAKLREENERLRGENSNYRESIGKTPCNRCRGSSSASLPVPPQHHSLDHLSLQNAQLKAELSELRRIVWGKYVEEPATSSAGLLDHRSTSSATTGELNRLLVADLDGNNVLDGAAVVHLAVTAMDELVHMALLGEPLWVPNSPDHNTTYVNVETLNVEEYAKIFQFGSGPMHLEFDSEASRDFAVVMAHPLTLVEMLMDLDRWSRLFSTIVSKAVVTDVLSAGLGGTYNEALQVMCAEFHVLSPLVPTRESYFARYCKQHADGSWVVADVSLDILGANPVARRSRRRPSGCVIQLLPSGFSKVTWVEHVELDPHISIHGLPKPLAHFALGFGATGWLTTLARRCNRLAGGSSKIMSMLKHEVMTLHEGVESTLTLAERMVTNFCIGISSSRTHHWINMCCPDEEDDVRVMFRYNFDDLGQPLFTIVSVSTSIWIPVPPRRIFDFLRGHTSRSKWDILSERSKVVELARVSTGPDQADCVSLFKINRTEMLILQESSIDHAGGFMIVHAPVDDEPMFAVLNGGYPDDCIMLIPAGFAILPAGDDEGQSAVGDGEGGSSTGGSLLTVAFQLLGEPFLPPSAYVPVSNVKNLVHLTLQRIHRALLEDHATNRGV